MTEPGSCPSEAELLILLDAEESDGGWNHVDTCAQCQCRLRDLEAVHSPEFFNSLQMAIERIEETVDLGGESDADSFRLKFHRTDYVPDRNAWRTTTSRTITGYQIGRQVGRGGMGDVHLARRLSDGEFVVVKLLREPKPAIVQRFRQEISAAKQLRHDNLIAAVDGGIIDETLYLISEFVEGGDCSQIDSLAGPLDVGTVCAIAARICDALSYLHAQGVFHRDIKPSNIMVRSDGRVFLVDLGLLQAHELELSAVAQTRARDFLGTPGYMAPEQMEDPSSVSPASDLYSVAATMYRLLVGCAPFSYGLHPEPAELLNARLEHRILDMRLFADFPDELANLIHQTLSTDPKVRPQSAEEFRRRLEPFIDASQLAARAQECQKKLRELGYPGRDSFGMTSGDARLSRRQLVGGLLAAAGVGGLGWIVGRMENASSGAASEPSVPTDRRPGRLQHLEGYFSDPELRQSLPPDVIAGWVTPRSGHRAKLSCVSPEIEGMAVAFGTADGSVATADPLSLLMQTMDFHSLVHLRTIQVANSPDRRLLAALSQDGRITVWRYEDTVLVQQQQESIAEREGEERTYRQEAGSLTPLGRILGDQAPLTQFAFDSTGRYLAAGGIPSIIRVWDLTKIDPLPTEADQPIDTQYADRSDLPNVQLQVEPTVTALAFSGDNSRLIVGTLEGDLRLFDPSQPNSSREPLHHVKSHTGQINRILVSRSGRWILTCGGWSNDRTVRAWTINSDQLLQIGVWEQHDQFLQWMTLSPDESRLVTVDSGGMLQLWKVEVAAVEEPVVEVRLTGLSRFRLPLIAGDNPRVEFTAGGTRLLVAADLEHAICLSIENDQLKEQTLFHDDRQQVRAIVMPGDGRQLLIGMSSASIQDWELSGPPPRLRAILNSHSEVFDLAADESAKVIIGAGWSSPDLLVWSQTDSGWSEPVVLEGGGDVLFSCALSNEGRVLAWGGLDGIATIVQLSEADQEALQKTPAAPLGEAETSIRTPVRRFRELSGQKHRFVHPSWVRKVAFTSDGRYLLTACQDQSVRVWPVSEATAPEVSEPLARFEATGIHVASMSFDNRTGCLVAGMGNGAVFVWKPQSPPASSQKPTDVIELLSRRESFGEPRILNRHSREIYSLEITNDSRLFVAGFDGLLTEWQLPEGTALREWQFRYPLTSVKLLPDNRTVIAGTNNGVLFVLDLQKDRPG